MLINEVILIKITRYRCSVQTRYFLIILKEQITISCCSELLDTTHIYPGPTGVITMRFTSMCACIYLKITPSNLSFGLSAGNISNSNSKSHTHINIMLTQLSFTEPKAKLTFTGQLQNLIIMQISSKQLTSSN